MTSNSPAAARQDSLQLLVGGQAEVVARHRKLLEVLGSPGRVRHVGGYGAGYTAKLLINLLWFGQAVRLRDSGRVALDVGATAATSRTTWPAAPWRTVTALGRCSALEDFRLSTARPCSPGRSR